MTDRPRLHVEHCDRWGCPFSATHFSDRVARARVASHKKREHPPLVDVPLPFD